MAFLVHQPWRDAARWHAEGLWRDESITDLLCQAARRRPEAIAVVDGRRRVTWSSMQRAAAALAQQLCELGVGPGDIVVVQLPDGAATLAIRAAVDAIGAVCAPLSHHLGANEVAAVVDRTGARVAVVPVGAAAPTEVHLAIDADDDGLWEGPDLALPPPGRRPDPDAMSDLMFTSGTTGRPKGVMNSANTKLAGLRGLLSCFDFGPDDVWGVVAPMSHNAGWLYTALPALATGATAVVVPRGDPVRILDTFVEHGVTATFLVPAHLLDLLHASGSSRPEGLRLRYVLTGAAPASERAVRGVAGIWGATPVSLYGMTECQANTFTRPDDPLAVVATTVGRACPTSEVALRTPADGSITTDDGAVGEIVTRGPTTFLGYFDDQRATSDSHTADGWFRSGDLGTIEGGNFRIVGRLKEVVIRGGATIVPDDVESACAVLGLGEVAVVGLPDERLGERVCLCVTTDAPSIDALRTSLDGAGVGRHLWPDEVRAVHDFPRTELGKVQRAKLRALLVGAS